MLIKTPEMYKQHSPKKGWGHGGGHGHHGKHHVGSYSENVPTLLKPGQQSLALGSNPQPMIAGPVRMARMQGIGRQGPIQIPISMPSNMGFVPQMRY